MQYNVQNPHKNHNTRNLATHNMGKLIYEPNQRDKQRKREE